MRTAAQEIFERMTADGRPADMFAVNSGALADEFVRAFEEKGYDAVIYVAYRRKPK